MENLRDLESLLCVEKGLVAHVRNPYTLFNLPTEDTLETWGSLQHIKYSSYRAQLNLDLFFRLNNLTRETSWPTTLVKIGYSWRRYNLKRTCENVRVIKSNRDNKDLKGQHLSFADLEGTNLTGANLTGANLKAANLNQARLIRADLEGSNLEGAHLICAKLIRANLTGANLEGAHLGWAHLGWANLAGANLAGANLSGANLAGANLRDAIGMTPENKAGYAKRGAIVD